MPVPPVTQQKVILLLVSGLSEDLVISACIENLGLAEPDARAAYAEARRRVVLAAEYHPDEELGRAITRLNDLYARSLKIQDTKTALAVQRELNRLLMLDRMPTYPPGAQPEITQDAEDLTAARRHLEALNLAPAGTGLAELARLVVGHVIDLVGRRGTKK
jgi:hypothetical protein